VDAAAEAGCIDIVAVLGAGAELYTPMLAGSPARVVVNPFYMEGMSSSIRAGVEALAPECSAAVILLADQPGIDAGIIRSLLETYWTSGRRIVAARYGGVSGAPVLFDRALFLQLLVLDGDHGARTVIEANPQEAVEVVIPEAAGFDVDVPEDLDRLEQAMDDAGEDGR
jgi:molybdenum cofactor cytidylyltransferase